MYLMSYIPQRSDSTPGADYCCGLHVPDRRKEIGKPEEIEAWTGFDFKGRNGAYSPMRWSNKHFTGTDYDQKTKTHGVYKFTGRDRKGWSEDVDDELGNYDYLYEAVLDHYIPRYASISSIRLIFEQDVCRC